MNNELLTKYNEIQKLINDQFSFLLEIKTPSNLYEPLKYLFEIPGKHIRPLLTILAAGMLKGDIHQALKPAAAIELLHNFTLIHDDIMDNSDMRRGRETIHKKWDSAVGILSGDLLLALAFRNIIKDVQLDCCKDVLLSFTQSLIDVCEGQGFDMDFEKRINVTEDEYFKMIYLKTGKLIENSLLIGGLIAHSSEENLEKLRNIGKYLGTAFQLQDDLLDLTAVNPKFGKVVGKDLVEGKKTFIIIKAKELFKKQGEIDLLNLFYQNKGLEEDQINTMIKYLSDNGIFDLVETKIESYYKDIMFLLDSFEDNIYKDLLKYQIESIFKRDY